MYILFHHDLSGPERLVIFVKMDFYGKQSQYRCQWTSGRGTLRGVSGDFLSLTDIARYKTSENPGYVIQNWMRTRNTVRFLGLWEHFHNPDFNYPEFEAIEQEAGLNSFVLTPKRWVEQDGN